MLVSRRKLTLGAPASKADGDLARSPRESGHPLRSSAPPSCRRRSPCPPAAIPAVGPAAFSSDRSSSPEPRPPGPRPRPGLHRVRWSCRVLFRTVSWSWWFPPDRPPWYWAAVAWVWSLHLYHGGRRSDSRPRLRSAARRSGSQDSSRPFHRLPCLAHTDRHGGIAAAN